MDDVPKELLEIEDTDRDITMLVERIPGMEGQVTDVHGLISRFACMVETAHDELSDIAQVTANYDEMLSDLRNVMDACQIHQSQRKAQDQAKTIPLWLGPSDFEDEQRRRHRWVALTLGIR